MCTPMHTRAPTAPTPLPVIHVPIFPGAWQPPWRAVFQSCSSSQRGRLSVSRAPQESWPCSPFVCRAPAGKAALEATRSFASLATWGFRHKPSVAVPGSAHWFPDRAHRPGAGAPWPPCICAGQWHERERTTLLLRSRGRCHSCNQTTREVWGNALSNSANGGSGQRASAAAAVHTALERMIKHSPGTGQRRGGQVSAWPHKPL